MITQDTVGHDPAALTTAAQDAAVPHAGAARDNAGHATRRAARACAALMVGALTLTACGGDAEAHGKKAGTAGTGRAARSRPPARRRTSPSRRRTVRRARRSTPPASRSADGKLTEVKMTVSATGAAVAGDDVRRTAPVLEARQQLERGTKYQISAKAKDTAGRHGSRELHLHHGLARTTASSAPTPGGRHDRRRRHAGVVQLRQGDHQQEGRAVAHQVTSSSGQKVVGHWFGDSASTSGPQEYWKAGSKVTMKIDLDGVKGAHGVTGVQNKTVTLHHRRSQVSTVDVRHAEDDGRAGRQRPSRRIPISAGSPREPHVQRQDGDLREVQGDPHGRLDRSAMGGEYDIKDVPHAMRLSTSGTFIHGNYWRRRPSARNTSHGCVGLKDAQGAGRHQPPWFYDNSLIGDVVRSTNSPGQDRRPGQRPQRLEHGLERVDGGQRRAEGPLARRRALPGPDPFLSPSPSANSPSAHGNFPCGRTFSGSRT